MNYKIKTVTIVFLAGILFSCAAEQRYPSITEKPTNNYTYGNVVWRELATPEPEVSIDFYKKVFGWTIEKTEGDERPYWIIKNNGRAIGGLFELSDKYKNAGGEWLSSVSVPSVSNAVTTVNTSGGKTILNEINLKGRGRLALINDPQKAQLILLHSSSGDPVIDRTIENQWLWSELWSNDVKQSEDFYKNLLNATINKAKDDSREYTLVECGGQRCMGIIKNPVENVRSHWMQYILVSDVNSVFEKAKTAGAKVLIAPSKDVRKGTVAVLIDPTGAPFAIQKWPIE